MTVTVPFSGYALPHGMVVERWSSAKLAGSPALLSASGSGSAPSGTCTTVAAQCVVSWVNSDHTAGTGARTYRSSATEEQYHNVTVPVRRVHRVLGVADRGGGRGADLRADRPRRRRRGSWPGSRSRRSAPAA